jgi:hypothetical protein
VADSEHDLESARCKYGSFANEKEGLPGVFSSTRPTSINSVSSTTDIGCFIAQKPHDDISNLLGGACPVDWHRLNTPIAYYDISFVHQGGTDRAAEQELAKNV